MNGVTGVAPRGRRLDSCWRPLAHDGQKLELADQALHGLAVTPTVHIPLSGSRAIGQVTGDVPSPETRERVLRALKREAQSLWADDLEIEDKLLVLPRVRTRAA
jgi:hypothetical protein